MPASCFGVIGIAFVADRGKVEFCGIEMWVTRRSEVGTGKINLLLWKWLTNSVADLGDVYSAYLLVDGLHDPVDVWLLAVETMVEKSIFGNGEWQHHVRAYSQG